MDRVLRSTSRGAHPYRDPGLGLDAKTRQTTVSRALLIAHSFLLVWSLARIVFDVSCKRIDAEGIAALLLCVALAPCIMQRFRARI